MLLQLRPCPSTRKTRLVRAPKIPWSLILQLLKLSQELHRNLLPSKRERVVESPYVRRFHPTSSKLWLIVQQIYATSEERKQRNRQAQAAFRERRTEYIKQLEDTIRVHETNLHNLQTAHRSAADECLMLRYKNSLLERILLEKGRIFCKEL